MFIKGESVKIIDTQKGIDGMLKYLGETAVIDEVRGEWVTLENIPYLWDFNWIAPEHEYSISESEYDAIYR